MTFTKTQTAVTTGANGKFTELHNHVRHKTCLNTFQRIQDKGNFF